MSNEKKKTEPVAGPKFPKPVISLAVAYKTATELVLLMCVGGKTFPPKYVEGTLIAWPAAEKTLVLVTWTGKGAFTIEQLGGVAP